MSGRVTIACLRVTVVLGLLCVMIPGSVPVRAKVWATTYCPPLSPAIGDVFRVSTVAGLRDAVRRLAPGTTILVADGTYHLDGEALWIDVPNVSLRSASGKREAVILDGGYVTTEMVTVAASNVIIADLTLRRAQTHPIHVVSTDSGPTRHTLIYNVHILDPGQQAIKINPHGARTYFADEGTVACSRIELTDAGRSHVWAINGSCYTGGIDGHQAQDWTVRDNTIEGFWCERDLAEHGIHFWTGSRDTLVERNVLVDSARGIGLGLVQSGDGRVYGDDPCPGAGYVGHYGGLVRNNWVFARRGALFTSEYGFDCGICLAQACGTQVLHNTVVSIRAPFSSIEWRFGNTRADVMNNLVSHNLRDRGGNASLSGNLQNAPLALFVDGANGDLHLNADADTALDRGVDLATGLCDADVDGDPRPQGAARDIGADELRQSPPVVLHPVAYLPLVVSDPHDLE